ncbi:MAG TPA: ABC transporter permease, partial [Rubrivivax sp.]|nr:ABC transporter permease [Rubrivivax sp.]
MSLTPGPRGPRGGPLRHLRAQWVLALLVAGLAAALLGLPLLTIAPNRLVSGRGVNLLALASGAWLLAPPLLLLATTVMVRPRRALYVVCAATAGVWLLALVAFAGAEAARQAALLPELARISLGGGFWLALWLGWAVYADALRRAAPPRGAARAAHALLLLSLAGLLYSGALDALSLLKEYANRQDVFQAALGRHLQIVATTLAAALVVGLPLGLAAARRPRLARPLFALLNGVQTVPSIALFGLLIGPLAWLGQAWPGWGLQGIGLLPAVIALTLYALLPIVHGVVSGLQQVPPAAIDAATGMGMSRRQRLWQVELPLALPVLHSALRLTTVQLVGLAVVAALIGAGGLGAIIFQGLLSSALDLVLLGVLPVVALALAIDAAFGLLAPT